MGEEEDKTRGGGGRPDEDGMGMAVRGKGGWVGEQFVSAFIDYFFKLGIYCTCTLHNYDNI